MDHLYTVWYIKYSINVNYVYVFSYLSNNTIE